MNPVIAATYYGIHAFYMNLQSVIVSALRDTAEG
nr:MAG TPA: hypothetical protein [Caudoviricetes sp.]